MAWARSPFIRFCAAMLASMFVFLVLVWTIRLSGHRLSPLGLLGMLLGWGAVISVVVARYWRGIDEAAREAQKSAWLWGGLIGMVVAVVGVVHDPFGLVDAIVPAGADRETLVAYGAGIMVVAQLAGFLLAWALWWWRRR